MGKDAKDQIGIESSAHGDAPNGRAVDTEMVASTQVLDRLVVDIARLIGRQMARQDLERIRASVVHDSASTKHAETDRETGQD